MRSPRVSSVALVAVLITGSCLGSSQLAPFYDAVAKDPTIVMNMDLAKAIPPEEIPVLAHVLTSGNPDLMLRAIVGATEILQLHVNDARPHFQQLEPSIAEVKQEFQALVPILVSQFNDVEKTTNWNGLNDGTEILWKTRVVQFMGLLGATPSDDMINWMNQVIQWPIDDGGRLDRGLTTLDTSMKPVEAMGGPKLLDSQRKRRSQHHKE